MGGGTCKRASQSGIVWDGICPDNNNLVCKYCQTTIFNSVQTRCIVKGEAQKSPLFWRFSGGLDRLFSRNSTRKPLNLVKSPIFTNSPCKSTGLYNAPSMHTVDILPDCHFNRRHSSEAWGPPQFQEKRSRSEKAILGALGEFQGILGATLGIRNSILGIRNSILGMAPHDLGNTKTIILGATPGAIPGIGGNPHERSSFAPSFSERFFENWGGPRAEEQ